VFGAVDKLGVLALSKEVVLGIDLRAVKLAGVGLLPELLV
jgi:hypothetical protein